ncbi:sulfate adenylyltransferase subunit CysN [Haliangium sp.]|uniref:sulfate adenylyltransferase subunit CysN n=1 Tax=Haliangium sp. TaxID=2663208 RepID=UPI003D118C5F
MSASDSSRAASPSDLGEPRDLLRLLTAGSVDDGKSTLIGRLLYDSKDLYLDQLASLERDSKRMGSAAGAIDYSLLVDGLKAEREQGITIDVAYRYFATPRRKFIIADCPGHEQYTRNMATGASTADLAVILVDARQGVLPQTRRHSFIASLLGIKHLVVAINKMDLVDYDQRVFERIRADYEDFAVKLEANDIHFMPLSALAGDNVVRKSDNMPWFQGEPLLSYLEEVYVASERNLIDLRLPVQYVLRPDHSFRGYAGTVASGVLRPGSEIMALPSGRRSRVASIVSYDGELDEAFPPMAVTVTLEDQLDVSRGDMLVHPHNQPWLGDEFEAVLVWMSEHALRPRRPYLIKHTTNTVRAEVCSVRYKFDMEALGRRDADDLGLNEIGRVRMHLSKAIAFDPYKTNRTTGSFIVIDPMTNGTVGAGMILDRRVVDRDGSEVHVGAGAGAGAAEAAGLRAQPSRVSAVERAERYGHQPLTVWLTGLTGAGKTTLAHALERSLFEAGAAVHVLDGENLRLGLSHDLGFTALDRAENIRRAAHIARLGNDAGLITIVALVSPFAADRAAARAVIGTERFCEVYLSAPIETCEARDPSGLYQRARAGQVHDLSGVDAPYEAPTAPELVLPTHEITVDEALARLLRLVRERAGVG